MASSERRPLLLLSALRLFYSSLGSFAAAAFTSLLGAALSTAPGHLLPTILEAAAVAAGFIGVAGLILGCVLLLQEPG